MKLSEQLRRKADGQLAAAQKVREKALGEDRLLSEDEDKEVKRLSAEAMAFEQEAKDAEANEAQRTAYNSGSGRVPVTLARARFEDDPKRGFKSTREFFMAALGAARNGVIPDNLKSLAAGSDEQGAYSDRYGGFLIPEGFIGELRTTPWGGDPTEGETFPLPMGNPTVSINARVDKNHTNSVSGGLRVYRRVETDTVASSRMEFERIKFSADTLMGVAYASEELIADSPVSIVSLLERGFGDEFGAKILNEKLTGTGVGMMLGIFNSAALITVAKETNQVADTIVYANIVKMRSRCWGYGGAIWLYNPDALPQLMTMTDASGKLIWQSSALDGEPDRILGRPAMECDWCNTLGDAGDVILANWGEYVVGTLQPIQNASSIHVRFLEHEQAFKFWTRNAGAPWWLTAYTPPKSTNTRSPFVVLAARA